MNPDSFFENDPWLHTLDEIRNGAVGRVVALAVQATCAPGALEPTLQEWLDRLGGWLGQPVNSDVLRNGTACSALVRYTGPVLGRLFIDENGPPTVSSFEIVGTDGLLTWKPDARALSIVITESRSEILHEDAYGTRLGEVSP